ncbi:hypothetical protein, variant [Cryptococcus amylolentus CBS 6039]|uniref:Uncharacterized protein n=1 Tax=Cryptococcus amylolentus CBS 6039 TaxID=1295533 RepID=A0A1E3HXH5_9TREE|nr:hypothetical protein, variant [Cryptococcus amylolentus CBS 6039]ODN81020.1 hypothetical protein, variant [Cryptococcus amylolentus CBS 6039]
MPVDTSTISVYPPPAASVCGADRRAYYRELIRHRMRVSKATVIKDQYHLDSAAYDLEVIDGYFASNDQACDYFERYRQDVGDRAARSSEVQGNGPQAIVVELKDGANLPRRPHPRATTKRPGLPRSYLSSKDSIRTIQYRQQTPSSRARVRRCYVPCQRAGEAL